MNVLFFFLFCRCAGINLETLELAFKRHVDVTNWKVGDKDTPTEEALKRKKDRREAMGDILVNDKDPIRKQLLKELKLECQEKVVDFGVRTIGISACHPDDNAHGWPPPEGPNALPPPTHALRTTITEVETNPNLDIEQNLIDITNRCMLHRCQLHYCLDASTRPDARWCRFGFPFPRIGFENGRRIDNGEEAHEIHEIQRIPDKYNAGGFIDDDQVRYLRNHRFVVEAIPEVLFYWRGNVDTKVIKNTATLINYIMKYVLKPETNSMTFNQIVQHISNSEEQSSEGTVKKALQKILLAMVKEHDMSKNEAHKIISKGDYVKFSRQFVFVNMTDKRRLNLDAFKAGDENVSAMTNNIADRYWTRDENKNYKEKVEKFNENPTSFPQDPRKVNLYTFASLYDTEWNFTGICKVPVTTPQWNYIPNKQKSEESYKSYCEVTLQLFKPGCNQNNMLKKNISDINEDAPMFENVEEALIDFVEDETSECPQCIREEYIKYLAMQGNETEEEEGGLTSMIDDLLPSPCDGFEELVEGEDLIPGLMGPVTAATDNTDLEDAIAAQEEEEEGVENLNLLHNVDHDWAMDRRELNLTNDDIRKSVKWIEDQIKTTTMLETGQVVQDINIESLNKQQKWLYKVAVEAMENPEEQKLIDVCGGAGTGKSYTINAILQKAREKGYYVQVLAPTGAAASQFLGGRTIHSFLKMRVSKKKKMEDQETDFEPLGEQQREVLEFELRDLRLIIIDEKSMVGKARLEQINLRLRQARPEKNHIPFGGISIIIAGDFKQLPPVFDGALYYRDGGVTPAQRNGGLLYPLFDENTFYLTEQMRQAGDSNALFREELTNLGICNFKESDYLRWKSFMDLSTMEQERREQFAKTATMLCAVKKDLGGFNEEGIKRLNQPIASSLAFHNCNEANKAKADEAEGLYNQLFFAKGAKVVLTRNLWCEAGLVNGSQGTVEYIIYKESDNREPTMPDLLLVKFPGYKAKSYLENEPNIVPIVPVEAAWTNKKHELLTRLQFPLIYGYAITIHKAKGRFFFFNFSIIVVLLLCVFQE